MGLIQDGEQVTRKIVWDGSTLTLTIFENNVPTQTSKGAEALKEFKKLVCAIK